ncbi:MAG: YfiR family protein [Xanthomonadaceae bacterium]|jgi:hypothetical protein|nr:YfiR family protein [Xanthomonadaceae bacterium]
MKALPLLLGLAVAALPPVLPAAAAGPATSAGVLAAQVEWLGHLPRFVQWPETAFESPEAPFRLCLVGGDPFGPRLEPLRGRRFGGRPLAIEQPRTADQLARCQLAYFDREAAPDLLAAAQDGRLPTLLGVAGDSGFVRQGGMLALVGEGSEVRLHVNLGRVRASRLHFSAKLLELARVEPAPAHGSG